MSVTRRPWGVDQIFVDGCAWERTMPREAQSMGRHLVESIACGLLEQAGIGEQVSIVHKRLWLRHCFSKKSVSAIEAFGPAILPHAA